jgi:hypothetical protein
MDVVGVWFNYVVLIFSGAEMYQMLKRLSLPPKYLKMLPNTS